MNRSNKILLTGLPGCGKTTAVISIVKKLSHKKTAGFYTQEIRQADSRKGFSWTSLDGTSGTLAHVNIKGQFKVGKYKVDVAGFEKAIVPILNAESDAEIFIIDEIGKMECLSEKFVEMIRRLFASEKAVLATVAQKGKGLISEVKKYPGIHLFHLEHEKQEKIISEILELLFV